MHIVTWNINSLRLRLPLLKDIERALRPDIICLQETKVPDALFPYDAILELGYPHVLFRGMKSYNGVAILSRFPLTQRQDYPVWCGREDCRHLAADVRGPLGVVTLHNFYIPAGGDIPDGAINPKFAHKLQFLDELIVWFSQNPACRTIVVGDFNIAPFEHDVWSHKQLLNVVSHTAVETERLMKWQNTGFVDAVRHFVPRDEKLYTWWSYRNHDWKASNRGRRLDHVWISPDLVANLNSMLVLKRARDWERPSDHVPVAVTLGAG